MENIVKNIAAWLNHVGNAVFSRLLKVYLGAKYAPVKFVIGDTSFTNHKEITVAISEEEAKTLSKGDLMRILTLKSYHEAGHCLYTDDKEYREMVLEMTEYFCDEAKNIGLKPYERGLFEISCGLCNSIEDGRMENQVVKDVPGVQKHREWYRLKEWFDYSSATSKVGDMYEVFNNILTIATMGMYCKDFETTYPLGTKVRSWVDDCIAPISGYVMSATVGKGKQYALEIAKAIKDLILDEMAKQPTVGDGPQVIQLPPELEELIRQALEDQGNFSTEDTKEIDSDGPIIGILTDDMEESEGKEGKTPDMVIDLRKNPPKPPTPLTEPEDEEKSGGGEGSGGSKEEGQDENSSETSDGKGEGSESSESEEKDGQSESEGSSEEGEAQDLEGEAQSSSSSSETPESAESDMDSDVDRGALQDGAADFENSIEDRLREALDKAKAETSNEVSQRVAQADKALEAAHMVENGEYGLNQADIDTLHEHGYLGQYADKVPCTNVLKDGNYQPTKASDVTISRGRQVESEIKNIIAAQSEPDRDYLFDGDLDEQSIGRFITFGQGDIFCQEGDPKTPDMCVYVRQDNSGSMSGQKFHLACEAGALIEQAFKELVPLKLTYFNDYECNVIKDWDDVDTSRSYMATFNRYFYASGGNDDALAIMSAALELVKRPEKHKVLIVISDGAPCCSEEAVTSAVKWARKNGIFVISFFIGDKNFIESSWENYKLMYEKYFCGVSPDKLGSVLVRFLRTMIESN